MDNHWNIDQDLAQTLLDLNASATNTANSTRPQILAGTYQPGATPRIGAQYQVSDLPTPASKTESVKSGQP